jgi:hypothetical protein
MRPLKWFIGLLLLPACVAVTRSLAVLVDALSGGTLHGISFSVWGLVIGFLLWLFIWLAMPRPVRTYVLAHELTHALWGLAMGAKVGGIKVSKKGGHVKLSRTNFLITLAPYFFPLYTVIVILLHVVLSVWHDMSDYEPVWLGWVGLTWGFHFTFTLSTLRTRQPDIQEHGRLFSYAVIYLFNVLGICLWIVAVSDTEWRAWGVELWELLGDTYGWLWDHVVIQADALYQRFWV